MASRPKKSPSSKARRKRPAGLRCRANKSPAPLRGGRNGAAAPRAAATLRREFRAWRASLPTALERETLLMPEAIAASVVQEAERFLGAELPGSFTGRLAAKAELLYARHRHFHQAVNRPGNAGRENLYMFMRHWTAGWLKRERSALYKRLPASFAMGQRLPETAASASGRQR